MIKEHIDVDYTADVIVDASYIRYSGNSGHLGHHPEVLGNFLKHPKILEFLRDFKYWFNKISSGPRNINVLVICPRGTKRAVSGAIIAQHIVKTFDKREVEKEIHHMSWELSEPHHRTCPACQDTYFEESKEMFAEAEIMWSVL